jgi:hypothetical protein
MVDSFTNMSDDPRKYLIGQRGFGPQNTKPTGPAADYQTPTII